MTPEKLYQLIQKYQSGQASPEEKALLEEWYRSFDDTESVILIDEMMTEEQLGARIQMRLKETISVSAAKKKSRRFLPVAAAILLFALAGLVFLITRKPEPTPTAIATAPVKKAPADFAPGDNKALLTLADGTVIILDSAANGKLGTQGNSEIVKLENGELAYRINGRLLTEKDEAFYNMISTPRGGQYQVTLSDGTKVWLNAASSIRFPVVFTGDIRQVEVSGETYFEVAKDGNHPFRVKTTGGSEVEVLGTHFNINAYTDESAIRTTLVEGKVKVKAPDASTAILEPGFQSILKPGGSLVVDRKADTEEALAWIKGRFQFKSTDLRTILRQISRWYDVDVEYRGNVDLHFTGQLTRNQYVSKVFEQLELTGEVKFRTEGRKIIVSRN